MHPKVKGDDCTQKIVITMDTPDISEKTFLALVFNAEGPGFVSSYATAGCQDLRRNALYTWMKQAIETNNRRDIDFLEIMVSVVMQLQDDQLI